MVSGSRKIIAVLDVESAEMQAALFGLETALKLSLSKCIVETDSSLLANEFHKTPNPNCYFGILVEDAR